jgi:hypothetical protein
MNQREVIFAARTKRPFRFKAAHGMPANFLADKSSHGSPGNLGPGFVVSVLLIGFGFCLTPY